MNRYKFIRISLLALLGLAAVGQAWSQDYPNKPIRWVVPFSAGGASDGLARALAEKLSASLGQRVVVDNRPGAGGNIGSALVAKSAPDGYTLLQVTDSNTISPSIYASLSYDPAKDFAPITMLAKGSHVIVAHPSLPVHDLRELIQYSRGKQGLAYATAGIGSAQHLAGEMLAREAGIKLMHVPYKGGGAAIADLVGGQVQLGILGMAPALPLVASGKLRALAVTGKDRSPALPNVPTVAESGVPGFASVQWFGAAAPAGTPRPVVDLLNRQISAAMQSKELREHLRAIGAELALSTPEEFQTYIVEDIGRWQAIVKQIGIRVE